MKQAIKTDAGVGHRDLAQAKLAACLPTRPAEVWNAPELQSQTNAGISGDMGVPALLFRASTKTCRFFSMNCP